MSKIKKPALRPQKSAVPNSEEISRQQKLAFEQRLTVDVLARTLWGEARGEGEAGMKAVACVVMNRLYYAQEKGERAWWGNSVIEICQKPYQFSCWNADDPNRGLLMSVGEDDGYFATAVRIARRAVLGFLADSTAGATHYHASGIMPYWTKNLKPTARIGRHVFYQTI